MGNGRIFSYRGPPAATRMADIGIQPHIIEAALNHISSHRAGVAGVYNRSLCTAETRQALDTWAAHVEAIDAFPIIDQD